MSKNEEAGVAAAVPAMCFYYCYDNQWILVGQSGGPDYRCNLTYPGSCENGTEMKIPAIYEPIGEGMLPDNTGEYYYYQEHDRFFLGRGSCERGLCLRPTLTMAEVEALAPEVAAMAKQMGQESKVRVMAFEIPAQPV